MPLLSLPDQPTATLAAVALRGLASVSHRHSARLAQSFAVPVYQALVAAPLTSPMMVEALANCLERYCEMDKSALYALFAVGSPVAVLPPGRKKPRYYFDKSLGSEYTPREHPDNECQSADDEDDEYEPREYLHPSDLDNSDAAVDLFPSSFDDCVEIRLLRLVSRALHTLPCGTESAYTDMLVALVRASAVAMEIRGGEEYVITSFARKKRISQHYAVSRLTARSFVVAPLTGLVCKVLLGDTTASIVVNENNVDAAATAASKAIIAADASARAKRNLYVKNAHHRRRLLQVFEISGELMRMLSQINNDTGVKLPFEEPKAMSALLYDKFNNALWENKKHVADAWREACNAADAAVRASMAPGVAALIVEVQKREEANLYAFNHAFIAYVRTLEENKKPPPVDLTARPLAAFLSAGALTANVMSLLPLLPVAPVKYFDISTFSPWDSLMTCFSNTAVTFDTLLATVRSGAAFAFHRLLAPSLWARGHRFANRAVVHIKVLASLASLRPATRGPLTANDTATGERWQDGFARRAPNKPPVPRDEFAAAVDLLQSPLGAVLALLQTGDYATILQAASVLIEYSKADKCFAVPGWEGTPLLLRAGLLPLLAAATRRGGLDNMPLNQFEWLLGTMMLCIQSMVEPYIAAAGETEDGEVGQPQALTAFQRRWLRVSVVEPLRVLCDIPLFEMAVKKMWPDGIEVLRDLIQD